MRAKLLIGVMITLTLALVWTSVAYTLQSDREKEKDKAIRELMHAADQGLQVINQLDIPADDEFEFRNATTATRFQVTNRLHYAIEDLGEILYAEEMRAERKARRRE